MKIKDQLKWVNLRTYGQEEGARESALCTHMYTCPNSEGVQIACRDCVGDILKADLRKIEPVLTKDNLERVIALYKVLL